MKTRAAFVLLFLSMVGSAAAQDTGGTIDPGAAIAKRIYEIEGMLGGDVPPERQAVALRWLADLYVSANRLGDAEAAYDRILAFYPHDTAASNAYAEFLLNDRRDPERALEVTRAAIAWSASAPTTPPALGETYAIRARAFAAAGKCEDALRVAEEGIALGNEDAAEDSERTRARCLAALGERMDAEKTLLALIGETGASNPDDESALIALLTMDKKKIDADGLSRMTTKAIEDARERRAKDLAREGATWVELTGENRVRLEATLRPGQGRSAVLFIPELGGRRTSFTAYAQLMALDGFTTLTLDLRGHGNSRCDSLPSFDGMSAYHRQELPADVAAAFAYLVEERDIDPRRIAIVAAGTACAVVERAIHERNLAPAVVYLSPIFADDDRDLASAISFRPPRPAFVVASEEDIYAVRSLRTFQMAVASDSVQTKIYRSAGHGVSILRDPARFLDVDTWMKGILPTVLPESSD